MCLCVWEKKTKWEWGVCVFVCPCANEYKQFPCKDACLNHDGHDEEQWLRLYDYKKIVQAIDWCPVGYAWKQTDV